MPDKVGPTLVIQQVLHNGLLIFHCKKYVACALSYCYQDHVRLITKVFHGLCRPVLKGWLEVANGSSYLWQKPFWQWCKFQIKGPNYLLTLFKQRTEKKIEMMFVNFITQDDKLMHEWWHGSSGMNLLCLLKNV